MIMILSIMGVKRAVFSYRDNDNTEQCTFIVGNFSFLKKKTAVNQKLYFTSNERERRVASLSNTSYNSYGSCAGCHVGVGHVDSVGSTTPF